MTVSIKLINKSNQCLVYEDNIAILRRSRRDVEQITRHLKKKAEETQNSTHKNTYTWN